MRKETLQRIGAVILALLLWQAAASLVGMDMLLASPVGVIRRLATMWKEPGFLSTILFSMLRIVGGFLIAFASGTILAIFSGRFPLIEIMLRPYVVAMKTVPVASFIILCLIWFSFRQLTVFIAFLISFPVLYGNVLTGIKNADPRMTEMASLYRVPWLKKLLYVYGPAIKPYMISASGIAMGMAWKAGVAAEVIGLVNGSIGSRLYEAKIYFQNADLLAWTVLIILLSVLLEKLFVFVLRKMFAGLEKL